MVTRFGALLSLGFLCGIATLWTASRRTGRWSESAIMSYLWSSIAALLGARWLAAAMGDTARGGDPWWANWFSFRGQELCVNGALLAGIACSWLFYRDKVQVWRAWLDALAPALGLALGLGSMGLFLQARESFWLWQAALGILLASLTLALGARRRFHGQLFVWFALGYGLADVSLARWSAPLASGKMTRGLLEVTSCLIALGAVAAWATWSKSFTSRQI